MADERPLPASHGAASYDLSFVDLENEWERPDVMAYLLGQGDGSDDDTGSDSEASLAEVAEQYASHPAWHIDEHGSGAGDGGDGDGASVGGGAGAAASGGMSAAELEDRVRAHHGLPIAIVAKLHNFAFSSEQRNKQTPRFRSPRSAMPATLKSVVSGGGWVAPKSDAGGMDGAGAGAGAGACAAPAGDEDVSVEWDCAVCIACFVDGEHLLRLPCSHVFHKRCLQPWFTRHTTCPYCRCDVVEAVESGHTGAPGETPALQSAPAPRNPTAAVTAAVTAAAADSSTAATAEGDGDNTTRATNTAGDMHLLIETIDLTGGQDGGDDGNK